ncbi:MAG: protein kinase [Candidatus Sumerlaeota bacterium]|nr:protein kinase [Candidatus Sumerlaeota bacterium]
MPTASTPSTLSMGSAHSTARRLLDEGRAWEAFELLRAEPLDPLGKNLLNDASARLEQAGRYDEALAILKFINERDFLLQEDAELRRRAMEVDTALALADLQFKNGRYAEAAGRYVEALRKGAPDVEAVYERLRSIQSAGQRLDPDRLLDLAEFFYARGQARRAARWLNDLLDGAPDFDTADLRLAALLEGLAHAQSADPEEHLEAGVLFLRAGRPQDAIARLEEAASAPETAEEANRRLAQALVRAGRHGPAVEALLAATLGPNDLAMLYEVQGAMVEAGAKREALQVLNAIRTIEPHYRDVEQRFAELDEAAAVASRDADPKMRELIGDQAIGRWRYTRQIGSGGMGVVHEVFDIKNNRPAAMKILRENLARNVKALTRFIREAQYVDQLNHANIVRIYDFNISKTPGQSFIAMEYISGPSLRKVLEERFQRGLAIDDDYLALVLRYCAQTCDALSAVHKVGIVHRDIKPDNILVDSMGMAKLTDFGILHTDEGDVTPANAPIGTPRYMAPEQVQGHPVDARTDIYAVGILMYEMATGAPPFLSGDVAYQQVHIQPTPPTALSPQIRSSFEHAILTCLEKDPDKRFQSAEALMTRLRRERAVLEGAATPPFESKGESQPTAFSPPSDSGKEADMDEFDE